MKKMKKNWKEYMWIVSLAYLVLGFFNIVFAWIGMICFIVPLILTLTGKGKVYCNQYCGRGQLLGIMGSKLKLSRYRDVPKFLRTKWFRYGFLVFFMTMFLSMVITTYMVFSGAKDLQQVITLLWTFKMPWNWVNTSFVSSGVAQFAFGFFSLMLTSTILGIITAILYKPRSWCVYCPMGTMTQMIAKAQYKGK